VQTAWTQVHHRQAQEFFIRVAAALDRGDPEALAAEVQCDMDQPWAHEGIVAGFQLMMASVDEAARPCIAALVADYLKNQTAPDRFYRRAGKLLSDLDRPLVDAAIAVFGEIDAVTATIDSGAPISLVKTGQQADEGTIFARVHRSFEGKPSGPSKGPSFFRWSDGVVVPLRFGLLVELLDRNEFGERGMTGQLGFAAETPAGPGTHVIMAVHDAIPELLRLSRYVAAACQPFTK
jgi:hypothetical protein